MRGSARNVANWQAHTAPTPTSYHVIVDQAPTLLRTLRDVSTGFHTVGLNTRSLGISFLHQAHRWTTSVSAPERRMLQNAAWQCAQWSRLYGIPVRWITLAQANRGIKGFIRHSVADPARRSDPGANFPATLFFQLINQYLGNTTPVPPTPAPTPTPAPPIQDQEEAMATKLIQDALRDAGYDPGPSDGIPGARTRTALAAAFGNVPPEEQPAPPAPPQSEPWEGKRLRATAPSVNFYDSPRWERPTGQFSRGQHFPVIEGIHTEGTSRWYRVRNSRGAGPFFVTTRADLVQLVD